MIFSINRLVDSTDTNRYKKHHNLVQKLAPSLVLGRGGLLLFTELPRRVFSETQRT